MFNTPFILQCEIFFLFKEIFFLRMKKKRRPRMGRVQGGARAAFATPSWGPARIQNFSKFGFDEKCK